MKTKTQTKRHQKASAKPMKHAKRLKKEAKQSCIRVDDATPEESAALVQAAALSDSFARVTQPSSDLIAEAKEMSTARDDVADLMRRGYPVTSEHFDRIETYARLISRLEVQQTLMLETQVHETADAQAKRDRLFTIQERLMRIVEAAGVENGKFTSDFTNLDTLRKSMLDFSNFIREKFTQLSDADTVRALLSEADALVESAVETRMASKQIAKQRTLRTKAIDQLKRLLFDEMRHVSKQGLAAYPDDVMRDLAYRLERFASKNKRAKNAPETPVTPELKAPDFAA